MYMLQLIDHLGLIIMPTNMGRSPLRMTVAIVFVMCLMSYLHTHSHYSRHSSAEKEWEYNYYCYDMNAYLRDDPVSSNATEHGTTGTVMLPVDLVSRGNTSVPCPDGIENKIENGTLSLETYRRYIDSASHALITGYEEVRDCLFPGLSENVSYLKCI